ncbi:MAG TPA: MBL fold metallo-hydrolase [Roseiflexaceae bacterium]|nr:MBL fold metallo-hydrolase [Roseiflexaceae bacterium]
MDTRSAELITRIDHLEVPRGQLALWSLGQAGFVLKGGATIAYIDPYLSSSVAEAGGPGRRFPVPVEPSAVRHAHVVLTTHEHIDHVDGQTLGPLMAASPQATLVTTHQGREIALEADVPDERILVPRLGERIELAGLAFTATPAAHYQYEVDEAGHSRWMGYVVELNGVTLYHAGDTIVVPELLEAVRGLGPDIALIPINGRDHYRERMGIIGNLWPGEAVELAREVGAKVLIGIHNDLFDANRVSPGLLFDELDRRAPFQRCHILQPGELYLYAG